MTRFIFSILLSLSIVGCASNPSQANKIAQAGGLNVVDVPGDKLPTTVRNSKAGPLEFAASASIPVGTAAHIFTPEPGLSVGAATGLSLLSMVDTQSNKLENQYRILAWAPMDFASNEADANKKMLALVESAVSQATTDSLNARLDTTYAKYYYTFDSSTCNKCAIIVNANSVPSISSAPDWLGGYKAYAWTPGAFRNSLYFSPGYPFADTQKTLSEKMDFFRRVSEKLPSWAYIYIPASAKGSPIPLILSQGKPLLFVKPGTEIVPQPTQTADRE